MQSQHLVVDLVKTWHKAPDNAGFMTKELDLFNITLVSIPVEFEGTEEFKALVLWNEIQDHPNKGPDPSDLQRAIFDTVKRFAIGVNAKVHEIKHDRMTTYIKLRTDKPKNVTEYEWLDLKPEDYKNVG